MGMATRGRINVALGVANNLAEPRLIAGCATTHPWCHTETYGVRHLILFNEPDKLLGSKCSMFTAVPPRWIVNAAPHAAPRDRAVRATDKSCPRGSATAS